MSSLVVDHLVALKSSKERQEYIDATIGANVTLPLSNTLPGQDCFGMCFTYLTNPSPLEWNFCRFLVATQNEDQRITNMIINTNYMFQDPSCLSVGVLDQFIENSRDALDTNPHIFHCIDRSLLIRIAPLLLRLRLKPQTAFTYLLKIGDIHPEKNKDAFSFWMEYASQLVESVIPGVVEEDVLQLLQFVRRMFGSSRPTSSPSQEVDDMPRFFKYVPIMHAKLFLDFFLLKSTPHLASIFSKLQLSNDPRSILLASIFHLLPPQLLLDISKEITKADRCNKHARFRFCSVLFNALLDPIFYAYGMSFFFPTIAILLQTLYPRDGFVCDETHHDSEHCVRLLVPRSKFIANLISHKLSSFLDLQLFFNSLSLQENFLWNQEFSLPLLRELIQNALSRFANKTVHLLSVFTLFIRYFGQLHETTNVTQEVFFPLYDSLCKPHVTAANPDDIIALFNFFLVLDFSKVDPVHSFPLAFTSIGGFLLNCVLDYLSQFQHHQFQHTLLVFLGRYLSPLVEHKDPQLETKAALLSQAISLKFGTLHLSLPEKIQFIDFAIDCCLNHFFKDVTQSVESVDRLTHISDLVFTHIV